MPDERSGLTAEDRKWLEGKFESVRTDLKADIAGVRTELKEDIASLRKELVGVVDEDFPPIDQQQSAGPPGTGKIAAKGR